MRLILISLLLTISFACKKNKNQLSSPATKEEQTPPQSKVKDKVEELSIGLSPFLNLEAHNQLKLSAQVDLEDGTSQTYHLERSPLNHQEEKLKRRLLFQYLLKQENSEERLSELAKEHLALHQCMSIWTYSSL